jgi:alpha-tubulin suppressor-like RCC1 family protein
MKRWILWIAVSLPVFFLSGALWANNSDSRNYDPATTSINDPILPGPKLRGAAEGLGIGSLISSATMATPKKADGSGGDIIVWGYRYNGHSGNSDWYGGPRGYENNSAAARRNNPRFETVRNFKDTTYNKYLAGQKVVRLFTTAHNFYALTEEGELWAWGDSLHGTAGCINTGYETTQYGTITGTPGRGPHYQARPCPVFGTITPTAQVKKKIAYIDGGEYNAIAITADGEVYTWGSNAFSQTTGSGGNKTAPLNITHYFQGETVTLVGGAYEGQYAVSVDRSGKYTLWGWGRSFGRSLTNSNQSIATPIRLTQYNQYAKDIIYVNGGYGWTGVLLADGRVVVSGLSRHTGIGERIGAGDSYYSYQPRVIMGPGSAANCWDPSTKTSHACPRATRLIVRYAGGVAVPDDDGQALYTWGGTPSGGAYFQVYGSVPVKRKLAGTLKSVGATKEAVFYLTNNDELYGVGYGDQRVINVCDNNTISWDRNRGKVTSKNSMNWVRKKADGTLLQSGYRIPYEDWIDVTGVDYCDGSFPSNHPHYPGKSRSTVREWTGYDDGRDGPVPSDSGALTCQDNSC